jgi:hypothetical protein
MMAPDVVRFMAEKRARLLLGIACAVELGDMSGARRLFLQAVKKNYFATEITKADRHAACAGVWLIKELALHPEPVAVIFKRGKKAGYTRLDLQRAAGLLRVTRSKRVGCGVWVWMLTSAKHCVHFKKMGSDLTKNDKAPKALKVYKTLN